MNRIARLRKNRGLGTGKKPVVNGPHDKMDRLTLASLLFSVGLLILTVLILWIGELQR
jgi:hypothetical protein